MRYFLFILAIIMSPVVSFADGFINLKFAPYDYVKDPHGIDCRSYGMLGPVYIIIIYPAKVLNTVYKGRIGNSFPQLVRSGQITISSPKQLVSLKTKNGIIDWLAKGKDLRVNFINANTRNTYKFPLPNGVYYIQYLLEFKKTRLDSLKTWQGIAGPSYTKDDFGEYYESASWGKNKVVIENNTVDVLFKSHYSLGMNGVNFTNYFRYLLSAGEWVKEK